MTNIIRLVLAVAIVTASMISFASAADPWPQRTVRLIAPISAGTATDLAARLFAERLSKRWGQPVVVENRPGADGIVAVNAFLSVTDHHALLFSFAGPISINPLLYDKLPYDPGQDLVPVASAIDNFFAIAVASSLGVDTIADFIEMARRRPGKLNWAATPGLPQYIFVAFQKRAGVDLVEVPYKEIAPMLQDLGQGRVDVAVTGSSPFLPLVESGKARMLMVTNRERSPLAPQVPTAAEAGFPDLLFEGVVGFYGWRGMPADLRQRIATDINAAAADPALVERLRGVGSVVRTGTPADFVAAIEDQKAKVRALARPRTQ
jgi:tripartite-type tricarboxylate transporter receptor subunit TctC